MSIQNIYSKINQIQYLLNIAGIKNSNIYYLIFIMFVGSLFEMVGLGLILPTITFIIKKENIVEDYFNIRLPEDELIFFFCTTIFLVFLLKFLFLVFVKYKYSKLIFKFNTELSNLLFIRTINKNYLEQAMASPAEIAKNVQTEVSACAQGFLGSFLSLLFEVLSIISILIFLFTIYPEETLIVILICFFILTFYQKLLKNKIAFLGHSRVKIETLRYKYLFSTFSSIKEILLANKTKYFTDRFEDINSKFNEIGRKQLFLNAIPASSIEFLIIFLMLVFLSFLLFLQTDFQNILVTGSIFGFCLFRIIPSIIRINSSLQLITYHNYSLKLVYEILKVSNDKFVKNDKVNKIKFSNNLTVKNLIFNYPNSDFMLEVKNFIINKNEIVGIFGESGSGKSTFIDIISGLITNIKGEIFVDDKKIEDLECLKKLISYVPQDICILNDSIKNNILFGINNEEIDNNKIKKVILKSRLQNYINKLKNGINTELGEKGLNISGGEKQRLGIARALYRERDILILDESTAGLDQKNEEIILDELVDQNTRNTIIIVSHKLSILKKYCNSIYFLDNTKLEKLV